MAFPTDIVPTMETLRDLIADATTAKKMLKDNGYDERVATVMDSISTKVDLVVFTAE